MTYAEAFELLVALIKRFEGCVLRAYPDPASPLSKELHRIGKLKAYCRGQYELSAEQQKLSGTPWTIGYGETLGIVQGELWTQEHAEAVLRTRLVTFLTAVLKKCPALHLEPVERLIACTSLAYNIGVGAFGASSVSRMTMRQEFEAAARAFLLWNKAGGKVLPGLDERRHIESEVYLSAQ